MKTNIRNSNFEILRLCLMFAIVLCHWAGHGVVTVNTDTSILINKVWLNLCNLFGQVANSLFILMLGYFQINRSVKKSHITNIIFEVTFYSVLVWVISLYICTPHTQIRYILKAFLPFIYGAYWFVIPYFILYLLSPFLNRLYENLTTKEISLLLTGLLIVEGIFPLIGASGIYSNLGLFILLYLIGASLNKYQMNIDKIKRYRFAAITLLAFFAVLSAVVINLIGNNSLLKLLKVLFGRFSLFTMIIAVTIFVIVMYMKPFSNTAINTVSKSAFAVYLISENENIYDWLWKVLFNNSEIYSTYLFIPISLRDSLLVFSVCLAFDILLKNVVLKLLKLPLRK